MGVLLLAGFVVQLNSERAYWFYSPDWFTTRLGEMVGISMFYAFAAAGAMWMLGRLPYGGVHQVVLAGALFGWTVEGVIVYVLHEAGPFDVFFPAMFAGWHGVLSFTFFLFLIRTWLLAGAVRRLAAASTLYGIWWGLWATTSRLPESDQALAASAASGVTAVGEFAVVALLLTGALGAGHYLIDRLWPGDWKPGRVSGWLILGTTGLYAVVSGFAIPWAPIRWAVLVAIPVGALVRSGRGRVAPNVYSVLSGRIDPRHLVALAPIGVAAGSVYGLTGGLSEGAVESLFLGMVGVQMLGGAVALVWAVVRSRRVRPESDIDSLVV